MALDDPLILEPPVQRAAYSDRTAWLMAQLSQLAYEYYEREVWDIEGLAQKLAQVQEPLEIAEALNRYREQVRNPSGLGQTAFAEKLAPGGFELKAVFDQGSTQGFLAWREHDDMAVLAFRGTEIDRNDIRADIEAWQDDEGAHTGFRKAYDGVKREVLEALRDALTEDTQLYLTGHSLGGALAMMAAHHLSKTAALDVSDRIAACYTFGGPKVGNREFTSIIKVPIYRVVNAADIVPWLPINFAMIFAMLAGVARLIPFSTWSGGLSRWLTARFDHTHHGDLRLLIDGDSPGEPVKLIPNPTVLEQLLRLLPRIAANWSSKFTDHRISAYCEKLERYARARNQS